MRFRSYLTHFFVLAVLAVFGLFSFPIRPVVGSDGPVRPAAIPAADISPVHQEFVGTATDKMPVDLLAAIGSSAGTAVQDVIIQFADGKEADGLNAIKAAGGRIKTHFAGATSVLAAVQVGRLESIASNPSIVFITPDRQIKASLDSTNILVGTDKLQQPAPSSYGGTYMPVDGKGVGIAVIDSGINAPSMDDFRDANGTKSRIVHFKDWAGNTAGQMLQRSYDDYGHGTPVAGVAAGNG